MVKDDVINSISTWTNWAANPNVQQYDIAIFKIWIQFEKYLGDLFVKYATGEESADGFAPSLNIRFASEEQLNIFLREGNKTYIDYSKQIQKLSKHIFQNNPFDVIFEEAENYNVFLQLTAIRNYIAHESGESKAKLIKTCFGGDIHRFTEPNQFLMSNKRGEGTSYYTYFTQKIRSMAELLSNPTD